VSMYEKLKLTSMVKSLKQVSSRFSDPRTRKNYIYEMEEVAMSAFGVFFTQSPSFLARQRDMKMQTGRSNAERLLGLNDLPSDNQIRNLLDGVSPDGLQPIYRQIFSDLEEAGEWKKYRSFANQLLIAIDGTEYFSSKAIHCENCNHREGRDGKIQYFHSVLTPVVVQAGNKHVIALEPEFILPQDGHEKQDCEIQAAKRWVEKWGEFYARRGVTLLGDDLFSRQPFCQAILEKHLHFILVCKEDSHADLTQTIAFLAANQVLGSRVVRRWVGKYAEIATYRFANQIALHGGTDALQVNWCEVSVIREDTGEQLYKNAWVTDFLLSDSTVEAVVRDGRARWKVENENNNVLKTKGYHLEHNFGHGSQTLAAVLLSLNLIAFLFHTVLDLVDDQYRAIRQKLVRRQTFFQDLEALLRYHTFESWEELLNFMAKGLEINSG
jgi:hypothetical protein